ncbi:Ribonuclease H [Abeliophyllum distichum]|uniref:Ribonuclease H n=1 Tax=Abeliophyllum distichum TaxID=126358 RepID=A0ABD1QG06_9LAMI
MAYGAEVIIHVEVGIPSPRCLHFDEVANSDLHRANLDLQDKRHADSQLRLVVYQQKMTRYYNSSVRNRSFRVNDFVLKKVFQENIEVGVGTVGPTWEGALQDYRRSTAWNLQVRRLRGKGNKTPLEYRPPAAIPPIVLISATYLSSIVSGVTRHHAFYY